jgi:hypothetical protein
VFKFSFHFAINLLKYGSLAYGTLDLRLIVYEPTSLDGILGASLLTPKRTEESKTLLLNDVVALHFNPIFLPSI